MCLIDTHALIWFKTLVPDPITKILQKQIRFGVDGINF